jgi:hypothetical protein
VQPLKLILYLSAFGQIRHVICSRLTKAGYGVSSNPHGRIIHIQTIYSNPYGRIVVRNCILALIIISSLTFTHNGMCDDKVSMVQKGPNGELIYHKDARGNRIPDFSRCGYMGGGVKIPDLPVRKKLSPISGSSDDTDRIQKAIDEVSNLSPDRFGFRGSVLLEKGVYRIAGILYIRASGVVLRGEGQLDSGTTLIGTGTTPRTLISVSGKSKIQEVKGSRRKIKHDYVPWGAMTFEVESPSDMSVGDSVIVFRPSTKEWIRDIKMDQLPAAKDNRVIKQWKPGSYDLLLERTITAVTENRISLDAPIVNALEDKYGGGFIYRVVEEGRITQSGAEHLRLISEYQKEKENEDEAHALTGVSVNHAANCWVRNVTIVHFSHAIGLEDMAKFITVQDCSYLKPVSLITGGRRYPYHINGQYCLIQRCYSEQARHAHVTGAVVRGPNAFVDCLAENTHSDTGPHHRWAVGILWDNLKGDEFNAQDRGSMGSGHGWAGAQQVFWNCDTSSICVQQPPTAQNYAIGCLGKISTGTIKGRQPGYYESHGTHVEPRSLYLKQLEDRLGQQAVVNITTEAQRKGTIYSILKQELAK